MKAENVQPKDRIQVDVGEGFLPHIVPCEVVKTIHGASTIELTVRYQTETFALVFQPNDKVQAA